MGSFVGTSLGSSNVGSLSNAIQGFVKDSAATLTASPVQFKVSNLGARSNTEVRTSDPMVQPLAVNSTSSANEVLSSSTSSDNVEAANLSLVIRSIRSEGRLKFPLLIRKGTAPVNSR